MCDDYGYMISCPFCGSEDVCKHLVAGIDFENAVVGGGLCFDREGELMAVVREGFESVLATQGKSVEWDLPRAFDDAWQDFICRRDAGEGDPLDSGTVARVVAEMRHLTDAVSDRQPGAEAFYSRRPKLVYDQLVNGIREAFAAAKAKQ